MSEFERRKRYLKYNDSECAIFLRKDFDHKCAYCLTREADLGNPSNFEKDHFVPQKGGHIGTVHTKYNGENFDVNSYYNLYYACCRCNGREGKTNTWSPTLLDPCLDKIWGKHIKLNVDIVEALSPQGEEYIETFHLNSKNARSLRKKIRLQNEKIAEELNELNELNKKFRGNKDIVDYINEQLEQKKAILKYGIKYIPNDYFYNDKEILEVEAILSQYNLRTLDGDYELDYEIDLTNIKYQVRLRTHETLNFVSGEKIFYLPLNQIKDWEHKNVLVCHYDNKTKKLYYVNFNEFFLAHPIAKSVNRYKYIIEEKNTL